MNFFERTAPSVPKLNRTEIGLFDYVVKNMELVSGLSIQKFARERFLSTTTILRFARKLGFSGYSDFTDCLLITSHQDRAEVIPGVVGRKNYAEEYVKNTAESVRVLPDEKLERVWRLLERKPAVYIVTDAHAADIGRYVEKLFLGAGLRTFYADKDYKAAALTEQIADMDLLIALSYSGQDGVLLGAVERVFQGKRPFLISVTRADNNALQNMSDVNFYVFADEIYLRGVNLTSRVGMVMIMELLVYNMIAKQKE